MRYQKPAVWFSRQSALRYLKTESDSRDTLSLRYPKAESWLSYKHCTRISKAGRSVRAHSLSPQAAKTLVSLMSEGVLSFSIVQEFSGFCKGENLARPALNQAVYSCIMEASAQTRKDCFYFYEGLFCYFTDGQAGLKGPACGLVSPEMEHPEGSLS